MRGLCKICGRPLDGEDIVAWRHLGMICGSCFLPFAGYVLDHMEELESVVRANANAPGVYGDA
jgi:hypothetical protein